jgi:hypothetical protein
MADHLSASSTPSPGSVTPEQLLYQLQAELLQSRQEQLQQQQQLQQLLAANQQMQGQMASLQQDRKVDSPSLASPTPAVASFPKTISPAKPDTYNGSRRTPADVWLFGLETFFTATNIHATDQRIGFAAAQLRDSAATWWRKILRDNVHINTWEQFKEAFVKQFIPIASKETARAALYGIKQKSSVVGYCDAFTHYLLQLDSGDMAPADQLFLFRQGLDPRIAAHLTQMRPKTLEEAMCLSQQFEIENRNSMRGRGGWSSSPNQNRGRPFSYRPFGQPGSSSSAPMELGQAEIEDEYPDEDHSNDPEEQTVHAMSGQQQRSGRRLTPDQVKEFMRRGVCFTCEKPGHVSRFCPKKSNKPQAQQKNA